MRAHALERVRVVGAFYTHVQCQHPRETLPRYSRVLVKLPVIDTVDREFQLVPIATGFVYGSCTD